MSSIEVSSRSTVLFPLYGFVLAIDKLDVLGRAELWSHRYVRSLKPRGLRGKNERLYYVSQQLQDLDSRAVDTYLAIPAGKATLRSDALPGSENVRRLRGWDPHSIREFAAPEADEILGLLAIAHLTWRPLLSPALGHQVLRRDPWYRIALDDRLMMQDGSPVGTVLREPVDLDSALLHTWFNQERLRPLISLVQQRSDDKLSWQIRSSLRRFPHALHAGDMSVQVVLAFSLVEGLLRSHKREVLRDRIVSICGAPAKADFDSLNDARNAFVHKGIPVADMHVCNRGHRLVASMILAAAELSVEQGRNRFGSIQKLVDYLDGLTHARMAAKHLDTSPSTDFALHQQELLPWTASWGHEVYPVFDEDSDWLWVSSSHLGDGTAIATFQNGKRYMSLEASSQHVVRAVERSREGRTPHAASALSKAVNTPIIVVRDQYDMELFLVLRLPGKEPGANGT